jgi:hypothetical protein
MPVVSTTLAGVNVWQFSGAITDAEIKAAWAGLVVNGIYVLNRAIYLDETSDLTAVTGGLLVDFGTQVLPGFILHTGRDKSKSTFKNFTFLIRTGLLVGQRSSFVQTFNGTALGSTLDDGDGLSQDGGGFVYGVVGNPGGGDPRFLLELPFLDLANVTSYSQEFTEQELQILVNQSKVLKGLIFEKAYGFPQVFTILGNTNVVVYRSTQNTQSTVGGGLIPIRLYPTPALSGRYASVCYVDSYVTRNNADITTRLIDTFSSSATNRSHITILNNYTRGTWFGTTKTNFSVSNWAGTNTIYGGVLKKLQFIGGDGGVVKAYDSRSTTASQRCKFEETGFVDFLNTSLTPTTDSEGKIQVTHIGAIATGSSAAIVRYTGQRYTFQKFGKRVIVGIPDMTNGDNDLSAFTPIITSLQTGMTRTQAQIQAATGISNYKEVLEELHNLAVTQTGIGSYNGSYDGNLFELNGKTLETSFSQIIIDPALPSKISYNPSTNVLSLKSSLISSTLDISEWRNTTGTFVLNNATISGVFSDLDGSRVLVSNLDPENFGVTWNLRYKIVGDTDWTELTGTGNSTTIILGLEEYRLQARVSGYTWKEIEFDTNISLSVDLGLQYHVADDGTPQWLKSFNQSLVDIFEYNDTTMEVEVTNTTGTILQPGFPELYRVVEKVQQNPDLVWLWVNPVTTNATSQKVLIPPTSPLRMYLSVDSDASVKITCPVVYSDTGISADDRVKGNPDGFSIILGSSATADSSLIVSQLVEQLGGQGFSTETHSLTKIKVKVDKNLTKTQYLGL